MYVKQDSSVDFHYTYLSIYSGCTSSCSMSSILRCSNPPIYIHLYLITQVLTTNPLAALGFLWPSPIIPGPDRAPSLSLTYHADPYASHGSYIELLVGASGTLLADIASTRCPRPLIRYTRAGYHRERQLVAPFMISQHDVDKPHYQASPRFECTFISGESSHPTWFMNGPSR